MEDSLQHLGVSFYLTVAAAVLSFFSAGFFAYGSVTSYSPTEVRHSNLANSTMPLPVSQRETFDTEDENQYKEPREIKTPPPPYSVAPQLEGQGQSSFAAVSGMHLDEDPPTYSSTQDPVACGATGSLQDFCGSRPPILDSHPLEEEIRDESSDSEINFSDSMPTDYSLNIAPNINFSTLLEQSKPGQAHAACLPSLPPTKQISLPSKS